MKRLLISALLGGVAVAAIGLDAQAADRRVVTMNTVQIFGTIDPAKISDYTDYMASANLYDGLANVDSNGNLVPELAEKWDVSPDATSVTFHIRPDAKFQDGSPVASRGRRLFGRAAAEDQSGPGQPVRRRAEAGQRRGDRRQHRQVHSAEDLLAVPRHGAGDPHRQFEDGQGERRRATTGRPILSTHVAGAGPYTLKSWDRGTQMTIERDPNYYRGWGEGPIDEVRFVITNDEATVRSMAASGELTMSSQYQSPDTYDALAKMPRFKIVKGETPVAFYLKLNTKMAPTDDVHIRKAIALATDYDTIHGTILPGGELTGPVAQDLRRGASSTARSRNSISRRPRPRSPRAAMPARPTFRLASLTCLSAKFEEEIALLMQSNLRADRLQGDALGRSRGTGSPRSPRRSRPRPMSPRCFSARPIPRPNSMFYTQYDSKAAGTWASMEWVQNPEVDKMIDAARATGDAAEQTRSTRICSRS